MASAGGVAGEWILLGRITKPHGIRGEVKVAPFSRQPENFLDYKELLVSPEDSERRSPYKVDKARVLGKQVLLQLQGCGTRSQAEELAGCRVWIRRQDLPQPGDNEFYLFELENKTVVTADGVELGQVTGILDTPAHDILSITGRGREYLIPLEAGFIKEIGDDKVVLDVPPGLLDINRNSS